MKKLHWICGLSFCSAALLTSCNQNQVDASRSGDDQGDDTEYVQPVIWTGPGWYYGIWFSTEIDFNNWNHHHYHYHNRDHDRRSDHHDRHRDARDNRGREARSRDSGRSRPHDGGARPHGGGGGGGHHERGGRK